MDLDDPLAELNWHALPVQIQQIAQRCGRPAAGQLLKHFDGRRVRIPLPSGLPLPETHELAVLGPETLKALAAHYPGQYLPVPRAYHALLRLRNDAIRQARREGESIARLAGAYGLTERQIFKIVGPASMPADGRQGDLFGA